jgi:hypothetical protein
MVLTPLSRGLAAALMACVAIGCVWVEEDPPGKILHPVDHAPVKVVPDTVDRLYQVNLRSTAEVTAFLGTSRFRIAFSFQVGGPGSSEIYVVEPGEGSGPLRILRYSGPGQTYLASERIREAPICRLSSDGTRLMYLFQSSLPLIWYQSLVPGRAWRIPLTSSGNGSLGILGAYPFWHSEGARDRILFTQVRPSALPSNPEDSSAGDLAIGRTLAVELESDSVLSPVAPSPLGTGMAFASIHDVSADGRWVALDHQHFGNFLIPRDRLSDSALLASPRDLAPLQTGPDASLNPFDSARTSHTDYHALRRFRIYAGAGALDSALSPRHLDGRIADEPLVSTSDEIWICDRNRRIILSQRVGRTTGTFTDRVRWTSHPNFLICVSSGDVYLVKIGADADAILQNPEVRTLAAAGLLRLATVESFGHPDDPTFQDVSAWIAE